MIEFSPSVVAAVCSAATFLVGIIVGRISMTKKERKDVEQKNYENTRELIALHNTAYGAYADALLAFKDAPEPTSAHFFAISRTGDLYFDKLNYICSSILSGKVDPQARDTFLLAKVRDAVDSLEAHYETLTLIAEKKAIDWQGRLRRSNYEAIYIVVERYLSSEALSGR